VAVAVNDRGDTGRGDAVTDAIRAAGGTATAFAADVTDERQATDLVAAVTTTLGPIDILVLNATGPQPEGELIDVTWEDHLAELDFFVKSPVPLGRAIVPSMRTRRFGRIIHIDSEVADRPPPGRSAYATAKNAQIGLMRGWVRELGPLGITVNAVAPGFIPVERHDAVPAATRAAYLATVPAGRMGTPADIAHVVSFLTSQGAGFVTGQHHRRRRPQPGGLSSVAAAREGAVSSGKASSRNGSPGRRRSCRPRPSEPRRCRGARRTRRRGRRSAAPAFCGGRPDGWARRRAASRGEHEDVTGLDVPETMSKASRSASMSGRPGSPS
jgi:3-oxoacyl-[acyl-carrier protein] reductase